ncbi:hypothetical protein BCR33DRAFT_110550 [Rhizoclosmatium globosum]|uniref:FAD-binding PCMH-type domain-containing protein n=1 Tax=Rhizoclosmatium globosum TaxID=329046 RepID=A0A1Y2CIH3_9FUNG|nr:hypothetical protein BCR33DRAFT_110550 [Rhizoclosmatium globosum]|eukprot:ORY46829.1 hypothetical protein BCR33DRAFT_110550 [Rhizoclosmatium globosum]
MSSFTSISVNTKSQTAVVGAGNWLGRMYVILDNHGFTLPGGDHPSVGVAGCTLGGGFGFLSRKFGLMLDWLLEVRLVDAKGKVRVVNAQTDRDLFWAIRGGGSGNFGIITSFKFKLIPMKTKMLTYQIYWWSANNSATRQQILSAYIEQTPSYPDDITSSLYTTSVRDAISLTIVRWNKDLSDGIMNSTLAMMPPITSSETKYFSSYIDMISEVWYYRNWTRKDYLDKSKLFARDSFFATSLYSEHSPNSTASNVISSKSLNLAKSVDAFLATGSTYLGSIQLDTWGGAISKSHKNVTSFIHRGNYISYQVWTSVDKNGTEGPKAFVNSWRQSIAPFVNQEAYQNYMDVQLPQETYFGSKNLPILRNVKKRVDPENLWDKGGIIEPTLGTCGGKSTGNGLCVMVGQCCSNEGECGMGPSFCSF